MSKLIICIIIAFSNLAFAGITDDADNTNSSSAGQSADASSCVSGSCIKPLHLTPATFGDQNDVNIVNGVWNGNAAPPLQDSTIIKEDTNKPSGI